MNIADVLKIRPKPEAYKAKKHDDLISKAYFIQFSILTAIAIVLWDDPHE